MEVTTPVHVKHKARFYVICSAVLIMLLTSCSSVEGVRVTNSTANEISVKAFFQSASDETTSDEDIKKSENNISFSLAAGASDFWQYEARGNDREIIDESFSLLVIKNGEGCSAEIDRHEIVKKAEKNGMWHLVILDTDISCQ